MQYILSFSPGRINGFAQWFYLMVPWPTYYFWWKNGTTFSFNGTSSQLNKINDHIIYVEIDMWEVILCFTQFLASYYIINMPFNSRRTNSSDRTYLYSDMLTLLEGTVSSGWSRFKSMLLMAISISQRDKVEPL